LEKEEWHTRDGFRTALNGFRIEVFGQGESEKRGREGNERKKEGS
jgi:hypothetical protein